MKKLKISALLAALAALFSTQTPAATPQIELGKTLTQCRHTPWTADAVIYEVNLRQGTQGRTFQSFTAELPRLSQLGVDILWLMPIHPISQLNRKGELGSYYAVADYMKVNPEFGTLEDFRQLVQTAHSLDMKVIIDEVCNHTGCDHPWTKSHPEYYVRDQKGKFVSPYDWTDTYKLNYSNPNLRQEMLRALKYWVAELDIDGYRCDVAGEVPTEFWNEARRQLNKIKPIFMLAEASKPELTISAFDADYNWPMKDLFNAIAATKGVNQYAIDHNQKLPHKTAADIDSLLSLQRRQYPLGAISMNMITNHDLNSWEGTEFQRYGQAVEAFAILSYTLPGIPMLYTGQEVGFDHPFQFFVHDQTPDYTPNKYTQLYTSLNTLKHTNRALDAGNPRNKWSRHHTTNPDIYTFTRTAGKNIVTVIVNLSNTPADVKFTDAAPTLQGLTDYFNNTPAQMPQKLGAWEYKIFVK